MRRNFSGLLALSVLSVGLLVGRTARAAAQTVLNFDDLSGTGALPTTYGGLIWDDGWSYFDEVQDPYNPESAPERIYDLQNDLGFDFATPTVFDGAYFAGQDYATVQFLLFLGGSSVWTSDVLAPTASPTFLSSGFDGLVDRVEIDTPSPDFWVMDDVTFAQGGSVTPEPATLSLMAMGLVGLAGMKRRRRHA